MNTAMEALDVVEMRDPDVKPLCDAFMGWSARLESYPCLSFSQGDHKKPQKQACKQHCHYCASKHYRYQFHESLTRMQPRQCNPAIQ